eukprot:TRINITY_DN7870_c0_g1_i1.p1 TRINITY_DN7870_c0_g1~~TRINITY_DN7870_c0_g1_i1.p1  ORF type:complete len:390 (-),score=65.17 TRINITY_DN7870_c0_g1_i1:352-1521(-)
MWEAVFTSTMTMTPNSDAAVLNNENGHGNQQEREKEREKMSPKLSLEPNMEHSPDNYDDIKTDYHPSIFKALERFLPTQIQLASRNVKLQHMNKILASYLPRGERLRAQKHKEYKEKILNNYMRLHPELYSLNLERFLLPSFLQSIKDGTEDSFRRIISEPSPGLYTFQMLQPEFCELMLSEVEHFQNWVDVTNFKIMRPNTMNKYGAVLDDFGFDTMLDQLMRQCISPMASVFFPNLCGASLDLHHGFIVEYGKDKDLELGFHVDDSEVTLNVCLGRQFTGGELFFRGVRCENHVNCQTYPEEIFEYANVPGHAILHAGRHRHGAKAIISGHRINLILWCRSSMFRELKRHKSEFTGWCGECLHQKQERQKALFTARKQELLQKNKIQ